MAALAVLCRLIDTVATISMLLDIPAIVNGLNSISPSSRDVQADEVSFLARGTSNTSANKARQIMRVCRILRLMRLVYLYNQYELTKQVWLAFLTAQLVLFSGDRCRAQCTADATCV